jgi:diadenosine tetraphosphate (Ap4A) HIT family hydrolase
MEIDELDTEHILAVMNAAKLMTKTVKMLFIPDGVPLSHNGRMVNELTHFHVHIVPRCKKSVSEIFIRKFLNLLKKMTH